MEKAVESLETAQQMLVHLPFEYELEKRVKDEIRSIIDEIDNAIKLVSKH